MKWLKRYTDQYRGHTDNQLLDELGYFGPYAYGVIVQMCGEKLQRNKERELNEIDCTFNFHERLVRQNLRASRTNVRRMLDQCQKLGLLSYCDNGSFLEIKMPMLLNLLDHDSKKTRTKAERKQNENRLEEEKEEDKNKNRIDCINNSKELFLPGSVKTRSRGNSNAPLNFESMTFSDKCKEKFTEFGFTQKQLNSLVDAFGDQAWIESELLKSVAWIESNPQKRPKKFPKFFNNWLQRGWESYRKTLPTNKNTFVAKQKTPEELRAIYGEDVDL